jgi:hypothetical protein
MDDALRPNLAPEDFNLREAREEYDAYVQRAREHHARTGEWPPDPLLDEVAEMRRKVMVEHGNDWRKLLRWYIEQDKLNAEQNPRAESRDTWDSSAGVSGL